MKAGGEGDNRGWDAWMASLTQWTWVWASSRDGEGQGSLVCCSPWYHRVGHNWATEQWQLYWFKVYNLMLSYMYILQNSYHWKFGWYPSPHIVTNFFFLIKCHLLVTYNIQYSIINCSHHTVCNFPRLYLPHNWTFVLFHSLHPFISLPTTQLCQSLTVLCFFFGYFRFHIELKSYSVCLYLSDLFHSG